MLKRLALLLALSLPLSAQAQSLVNCATATPCTISGPSGGTSGDPAWLAFGKINAWMLTPVPVTSGGNGLTTAILGDLRYGSGTNALSALAGNTTATNKFLCQTGTGSVSAAPSWCTVAPSDIPALTSGLTLSGLAADARSTLQLTGTQAATGTLGVGIGQIQTFAPNGAVNINGMQQQLTLDNANGANVLNFEGLFVAGMKINLAYAGTTPAIQQMETCNSWTDNRTGGIAGNVIPSFTCYAADPMQANAGITSGTGNNRAYFSNGSASGAASGGTVNNMDFYAVMPSGVSTGTGTTTNYGLRITGNGGSGTGTTSWAINSSSTAPSTFAGTLAATNITSTPTAAAKRDAGNVGFVLAQSGLPMILPPSGYMTAAGIFVIGQAPTGAATITAVPTTGSGTITFSGATLLNTAADVGRVVTILDTTYKYCTITAAISTSSATCTVSGGTLSGTTFANNVVWLSGTPTTNTSAFSVPFAVVYANAYAYFPASSPTGVAAFFFCQFATTTVATCFNNTYVSGTPVIPVAPTAFSGLTPAAFTQTTGAALTAFTVSLPGNSLGLNGELAYDYTVATNSSANNKTTATRFGGSNFGGITAGAVTSSTMTLRFRNAGIANIQNGAAQTLIGGISISTLIHGVIDTTSAAIALISLQLATATDWVALESNSEKVSPN